VNCLNRICPGSRGFQVDHVQVPVVGSGQQPDMVEHVLIKEPEVVGNGLHERMHDQPGYYGREAMTKPGRSTCEDLRAKCLSGMTAETVFL